MTWIQRYKMSMLLLDNVWFEPMPKKLRLKACESSLKDVLQYVNNCDLKMECPKTCEIFFSTIQISVFCTHSK